MKERREVGGRDGRIAERKEKTRRRGEMKEGRKHGRTERIE